IYSMGDPSEYTGQMISLRPGMRMTREELALKLVATQYERNDIGFSRGMFRIRGDVMEIIPANEKDNGIRVEFFGDEIERVSEFEVTSGRMIMAVNHYSVFPATHYASTVEGREDNIEQIERDLEVQIDYFEKQNLLLEAQRIAQRTRYDIEMLREIGFCTGIENYSRYFDGRQPGDAPYSLLDYFPKDFICFIDESHVTLPQIRGMYAGDRARKNTLVEVGFRLPSAFDNRPLRFDEFEQRIHQVAFVSATPGPYEAEHTLQTVEQIIRPTGLIDPLIILRPATGQVDSLLSEIHEVTQKGQRVLVTTLTKQMAERLSEYLRENGVRVRYLHSEIKTMERMVLLRDLRLGVYDVLVGINLLREGLDLPEVSLVAILDADKEGFLRSETSLVQTIGRAARNTDGRVIMYADRTTDSMMRAIAETTRRRDIQREYNEEHGITPESVNSAVRALIEIAADTEKRYADTLTPQERAELIRALEDKMLSAAGDLDFEKAAKYRDELFEMQGNAPLEKEQPQPARRRRTTRHGKVK
ncbi:MAG: excinuclease ABC subunit UvrB, partial [Clostridiales bacterium]|nr:excinuclease ABC subunit UvrB [Clostridiales bacterium]